MAGVRPQRDDKDSSPDAWVKRVKHLTLIKDKPHQSVFRLWLVRICEKCRSIILKQKQLQRPVMSNEGARQRMVQQKCF